MPSRISWSAKHTPDPEHPGYVKVAGSYAHDFLQWAKLLGKPVWHPRGDACVLGRKITFRDIAVTPGDLYEGEKPELIISDPGCHHGMYWPLAVLEPIYEKMLKSDPIFIINPHNGEAITRASI